MVKSYTSPSKLEKVTLEPSLRRFSQENLFDLLVVFGLKLNVPSTGSSGLGMHLTLLDSLCPDLAAEETFSPMT